MPSGLYYLSSLEIHFPIKGVSGCFLLLLPCVTEISVFNANSVDPDQTPRKASTLFANIPFMGRKGIKRVNIYLSD